MRETKLTTEGGFAVVQAPTDPLFRIGWHTSPLQPSFSDPIDLTLAPEAAGHRWDDPRGIFGVIYGSSDLLGAYLEVLAPFRDSGTDLPPEATERFGRDGWMTLGSIPQKWAENRREASFRIADPSALFVDVERPETFAALQRHFGAILSWLEVKQPHRGHILSDDRHITRMISGAIHEYREELKTIAGIRWTSKHDKNSVLWAVFDDAAIEPGDVRTISNNNSAFVQAQQILGLIVHIRDSKS